MLSSKKIKLFGVVGTFAIISTAYILHAKTFYYELHPALEKEKRILKSKEPIKETPKAEIEVINIEKPKIVVEPIEDIVVEPIEDTAVVAVEQNKSLLLPVISEANLTVLSPSAKLDKILKEYKYLHVEKSGEISPHSKEILEKIIPLLADMNNSYIEIEGHSSSQMYNNLTQKASEQSAQSVYKYLSDKKINKKMIIIGYGDLYPIIDDKKDERNSRVELKIRRR